MKNAAIFVLITIINLIVITGLYYILFHGLAPFDRPLSDGDLKAVYLPLTAFGYTFQIMGLICMIGLMNWFVFFVFTKIKWIIFTQIRFLYSYSIMIFCFAVFANKFDWWWRLVFDGDRFGYYTTRPATAAILGGMCCISLVFVSLVQNFGKKIAIKVCVFIFLMNFTLSLYAAYHVNALLGPTI